MVHLHVCLLQSYITSWSWFLVVCHAYRRHFGFIVLLDEMLSADSQNSGQRGFQVLWFPVVELLLWDQLRISQQQMPFKIVCMYVCFNLQQDHLLFAWIQKGDACVSEHPEREGKSLKTAGAVKVLTAGINPTLCVIHSQADVGDTWFSSSLFSVSGIWTESCETRRMPNSLRRGLVTVTLSFLMFH